MINVSDKSISLSLSLGEGIAVLGTGSEHIAHLCPKSLGFLRYMFLS